MNRRPTSQTRGGAAAPADSAQAVELEHTRALLRDSEARLNAILDTAVDGIVTIDERGIIESVNTATERMFGYARAELVGNNVTMLMPSPYHDEHDGYIARYLCTGDARIIGIGREVEGQRKDGSRLPIDLAVSELRLAGSRLFTGVLRDISARRQAESEARRRHAELTHAARLSTIGELTSGIAHEVNQPLTAMVSFAEACLRMLRAGNADTHMLDDALEQIAAQGQRAGEIIRHLRRLARKGEGERVPVDLNHLARDVLDLMRNELDASGIVLRLSLDDQYLALRCDRIQIEQVVLNLVRNAMDALGGVPNGRRALTIRTGAGAGGGARLSVEDTGPGFEAEKSERMFETFYTTKADGLGMGLAISRTIVEDHGGRLWAGPRPGGGAIFHVELPAAAEGTR